MKMCPACRRNISEFIDICPNCGLDLNSGNMDMFISIQNRTKINKNKSIVINFIILLIIALFYSPLKRYILNSIMYTYSEVYAHADFYNEISRKIWICDIAIWSVIIGFSIINIIRYKVLSNNSGAIVLIIACDLIIAALPYYLHYLSNTYMVQFEVLENWHSSRETLIKEVLKFLIWVCLTIEFYCLNKSRKIY